MLLTLDRDFGTLLFRGPLVVAPPGVVYFRDVPSDPLYVAAVLLDLVGRSGLELDGRFAVVAERAVRQRPMAG